MRLSAPLYLFDQKDNSLKVVPLGHDPVSRLRDGGLGDVREALRVHWPEYLMETSGAWDLYDRGWGLGHLDRISGVPSAAGYRRP